MYGRITLSVSPDEVVRWLGVDPGRYFEPMYNIAPTQFVAVVRIHPASGVREAAALRWGLVPEWSPDLAIGSKMINARSETVFNKTSFRQAIRKRRCIIPVSGFNEWNANLQKRAKRQPYLIRMKNRRPFALAGMWERNEIVHSGPLETFSILTTRAIEMMEVFHDRMPVIIPDDKIEQWLNPTTRDIRDLLTPFSAGDMDAVAVSDYVNSASHEGAQCVAPPAPLQQVQAEQPELKKTKSRDIVGQQTLFD